MPGPTVGDSDRLVAELDALLGPVESELLFQRLPAAPAEPALAPAGPGPDPAGAEPAPAEEPAVELEAPREPPAPAGPARVLVVEDNADYREVVRFLLAESGYEVLEAKNGSEGLRKAVGQNPSLVVMDFDMPGLNGYELLQELRSRDETRRIPVIMVTGDPRRRQLRQMNLDLANFLDKPVPNERLLAAVHQLVPAPLGLSGPAAEEEAAAKPEGAVPGLTVETAAALATLEAEEAESNLLLEEVRSKEEDEETGLDVLANDSPLVNRVNRILVQAVELGASDIHIEPQETGVQVRVRVNGSLRPLCALPPAINARLAARIKIMSNLVITERRRPQDGQFRAKIRGAKIEFRVSTLPSLHGENIVLRILGGSKIKPEIERLGFNPRDLEAVREAIRTPHGLILVTGPTGSGKTTTLYTMIAAVNRPDLNIMTAEDPVEYELPGIVQVHVKPHIGLTFEGVLRSFLRQDPNVMLVGEIRDLETADIAVKASITGHLVLSTLHTNSAPTTITRLTHMGLAAYLVADSVKLIMAQRLVKTLCPQCKVQEPVPDDFRRLLTPEEAAGLESVWRSPGCPACGKTGTAGRKPVFEVMPVRSPEMRQIILNARTADVIGEQAVREGMTPLRAAAFACVRAGETAPSEALRVMLAG
ncbi:MAG: Flp pilus assembly complex ATPase component TadA [Elusimicrobia bacterium]|nr:Flp pilus assembly complex ATPase component TadA [Elusimicrobiota bacterium]